jgi:putative CocE/NonD family hydrolase
VETKPTNDSPDHFTYDPANPVPFILVPGALQLGTTEDQRAIESRQDVLVYTSAVLENPMEVTGPIRVKLWAASSAPDTDWTGKLIDVHPDGYAQRLLDGIVRARFRESYERPSLLQPGHIYEYTIELWATSNVFEKGHRIRLEISSSSFPKYTRNLNTGANNQTSTVIRVAQQTIYHDAAHPSHVLLPVVPRPH